VFEGLDFVLAEARRRGILVILTLVNYWGDYGGMPQVRLKQYRSMRPCRLARSLCKL
jgi:endo-1,4-beta-mannosidase